VVCHDYNVDRLPNTAYLVEIMPFDLKEYRRQYYLTNKEKINKRATDWAKENREHVNTYKRGWNAENPEKVKTYKETYRSSDPERTLAQGRKYAANHRRKFPERDKARNKVKDALITGKLKRPIRCSKCGKKCKPQAHHHRGYAPEFALDVIWLCRPCHFKLP
jgi:hypothetical protein